MSYTLSKGKEIKELGGNGSFDSDECLEILRESDIVVTNPPFSRFIDFFNTVTENEKDFIVIGNIVALAYKDVFPYIKNNKVRIGFNSIRKFINIKGYEYETARTYWYTNLDIKKKLQQLKLEKLYNEEEYPFYDNYNAINVDRVKDIPKDYYGYIGVPITYLQVHNPYQFKICGMAHTAEENKGIRIKGSEHGRPILKGREKFRRVFIRRII